jgi:hypothetical protein
LFIDDVPEFVTTGEKAAQRALEEMGGYPGLISKLPFDRGDTNQALVSLCLKVAAAVETTSPDLAASLRAQAVNYTARSQWSYRRVLKDRSATPRTSGRSGGDVEDCRAQQSENNKSERGLRVVKHLRSWRALRPPRTTTKQKPFHVAVTRASNGTVRRPGLLMCADAP